MTKKPRPPCPRCGGNIILVAGLHMCEKCRMALQTHKDFDRSHDVPREAGMKKPLIREDD